MKKRILNYIDKTNHTLLENDPDTDWGNVLAEHLNQISFFQHERLVHLIVTVTFGLILVMLSALLLITQEAGVFIGVLLLLLIVAVTLVFYVLHYFLLENKVQMLYVLYDEILQKKNEEGN